MCEIVKWWEVATPHMELSSVLSTDLEGWVALGSPIFPSGCEGKLGVALESLQGLRDLT